MKLVQFSAGIEQLALLCHLLFQIIDISPALTVAVGDDGGAAAKPAEGLAKRDMKIEGKIALAAIVLQDALRQVRPGQRLGEFSSGRIRGIARAGDIVL